MRIGVNLLPLRPGQVGGAEVYVRDLLGELLAGGEDELVLVTADYNHESLPADSARCRRVLFEREGDGARTSSRIHRGLQRGADWYQSQVPAPIRKWLRPAARRIAGRVEAEFDRLRGRRRERRGETLSELIRRERLDLWFCPFTNLEPRICPVPSVITVHDLQHEYYPDFFDPGELAHRR